MNPEIQAVYFCSNHTIDMKSTLVLLLLILHVNAVAQRITSTELPAKTTKMNIPVNEQAPVIAAAEITITADPEVVWNALTQVNGWPEWQSSVTAVLCNESVREGAVFTWKAGGLNFTSCIHTCLADRSMFGWTGKTIGAKAVHNWFFEEQNGEIHVRVEESLEGFFPKLMRRKMQRDLQTSMEKSLSELKSYCEKEKAE